MVTRPVDSQTPLASQSVRKTDRQTDRSRSSGEGETAYKSRFGVSDRGRSRQLRQSDSVCGIPVSGINAFVGFFFIVGYLRLSLCLRFSISISLVASASGMYAALPSLRGLVRLLWSLLSSFLFFCLVLSLVASTSGMYAALSSLRGLERLLWSLLSSLLSFCLVLSLVDSASGMYAALPSLRGLVRLLWSLLSSLPFFCLVLSLVASAIGIDGDVRSLIQPSWPSATSLDFSGLCCHHHFSGCYCNCAW